jgi:hypothetical protein
VTEHRYLKKQFFIVFSPEGAAPPKIMHSSHKAALYAAVQMAKINPDASFFVMGSMSKPVTAATVREKPSETVAEPEPQQVAA